MLDVGANCNILKINFIKILHSFTENMYMSFNLLQTKNKNKINHTVTFIYRIYRLLFTIHSDTSLTIVTALLVTGRTYVKTTVLFFHPLDGQDTIWLLQNHTCNRKAWTLLSLFCQLNKCASHGNMWNDLVSLDTPDYLH